jgi:hypothetical protein
MRKSVIAALALWAAFAGKVHAEINYPWCLMGDTRGYECVFSSREQCMQDEKESGVWRAVHTESCLQTGRSDRFRSSQEADRVTLANRERGSDNMHWAETAMPLELQRNLDSSTLLRERLQLSMGTMREEWMVGGE